MLQARSCWMLFFALFALATTGWAQPRSVEIGDLRFTLREGEEDDLAASDDDDCVLVVEELGTRRERVLERYDADATCTIEALPSLGVYGYLQVWTDKDGWELWATRGVFDTTTSVARSNRKDRYLTDASAAGAYLYLVERRRSEGDDDDDDDDLYAVDASAPAAIVFSLRDEALRPLLQTGSRDDVRDLTPYDDMLFFVVDEHSGRPTDELWIAADGDAEELLSVDSPDEIDGLSVENDLLYFEVGGEAWRSDGTQEGTQEAGALPVAWSGFDAVADGSDAVLTWSTTGQSNNAGFEVERRVGDAFERVAFVEGAGTDPSAATYQYRVPDLPPGPHTFRLRQLDHDGASSVSPELTVAIAPPTDVTLHAAYPNPFRTGTTFRYELPVPQHVRIDVYDLLGRRVRTLVDAERPAGRHDVVLEAGDLAGGVYLYRIHAGATTATRRVTLLR